MTNLRQAIHDEVSNSSAFKPGSFDLVIFPELALNSWGTCPACAAEHRPCDWHLSEGELTHGPSAEAIAALSDRSVAKAVPALLRRLETEQDDFVRDAMLRALDRLGS